MKNRRSNLLSRFGLPTALLAIFVVAETALDAYGVGYVLRDAVSWFRDGDATPEADAETRGIATARHVAALPGGTAEDSTEEAVSYHYMLIDRRGQRLVRALRSEDGPCPRIWIDGQTMPMRPRQPRSRAQFPVRLCEIELEAEQTAWLEGRRLPEWPRQVDRVVLLGDTGCRLAYYDSQACNSEAHWPFARVAAAAAAEEPDLVIHVGDYHYREAPCSDRDPGCAGSAFGDRWAAWEEDFFDPASPLLAAAPWIAARGNHEDCDRAGNGWMFFLAPALVPSQGLKPCTEYTPPFAVDLPVQMERDGASIQLIVLDTARGDRPGEPHREALKDWCKAVQDQFLAATGTDWLWIVMHQPIDLPYYHDVPPSGRYDPFGMIRAVAGPDWEPDVDSPHCATEIETVREALQQARPRILLMSGDTHVFQVIRKFASSGRVDVVAGHGGTALDEQERDDESRKTFKVDETQIDEIPPDAAPEILRWTDEAGAYTTLFEHGYVLLERLDSARWRLTAKDVRGQSRLVCFLPAGKKTDQAAESHNDAVSPEIDTSFRAVSASPGEALLQKYGCVPMAMAKREPSILE